MGDDGVVDLPEAGGAARRLDPLAAAWCGAAARAAACDAAREARLTCPTTVSAGLNTGALTTRRPRGGRGGRGHLTGDGHGRDTTAQGHYGGQHNETGTDAGNSHVTSPDGVDTGARCPTLRPSRIQRKRQWPAHPERSTLVQTGESTFGVLGRGQVPCGPAGPKTTNDHFTMAAIDVASVLELGGHFLDEQHDGPDGSAA